MARVTVEDCIEAVPNAFELVLIAAKRARELGAGAQPTVDPEDEKSTVVALREIGAGSIDPQNLREAVVRSLQRVFPEETMPDEEELEAALMEDAKAAGADEPVETVSDLYADESIADEDADAEADETTETMAELMRKASDEPNE
jgi:DNA-directed RNA polymerase subunit omega